MPLAAAVFSPGDSVLVFESSELLAYVEERIAVDAPLLFLVKVADYQEDIPGLNVTVFSGNHGDSRNTARRPTLRLEWEAESEATSEVQNVFLEYGRTLILPPLATDGGGWFSVTFDGVDIRGGADGDVGDWRRVARPFRADWDWLQVRVRSMRDPVALGTPFEADLRNTWVRTGPAEQQEVRWLFLLSPTGARHTTEATYAGDHRWHVEFVPDELGPWRYRWTQSFTEEPYVSAIGTFGGRFQGCVKREATYLSAE